MSEGTFPDTAYLSELVRTAPTHGVILTLVSNLEELIQHIDVPFPQQWRKGQRLLLLNDLDETFRCLGRRLTRAIASESKEFLKQSRLLLRLKDVDFKLADRSNVLQATRQLQSALQLEATILACWDDVVTSTADESIDGSLEFRVRLLLALLRATSRDVDEVRMELSTNIGNEGWIVSCADILARPAVLGHCVVWMALDGARLERPVTRLGSATIYEVDWAIPNATSDGGQEFEYREELKKVIGWSPFPAASEDRALLARVDVGRRPIGGALDEAWRRALLLAQYVAIRAGSVAWSRHGWNVLLVDGQVRSSSVFATDEAIRAQGNPNLDRKAAQELARIASVIDSAAPTFSGALVEAADSAVEATEAGIRSRVLLRFRSLEIIASSISMDVESLIESMKGDWAFNRLWQRVSSSIGWMLLSRSDGLDRDDWLELRADVVEDLPGGRIRVRLARAIANDDRLLKLAKEGHQHWQLDDALRLLVESERCRQRLARYDIEEGLLRTRLLRVRNALTHGHPISIEAIESVDPILAYWVEFALFEAVEGAGAAEIAARMEGPNNARTRILAGERPVDVLMNMSS